MAQIQFEAGATKVRRRSSSPVLTGKAEKTLSTPALDGILISDSVPPFRLGAGLVRSRCDIVSAVPLFAGLIRCLEGEGTVSKLLGDED